METKELTNEKNELFESLKRWFAKEVKPRSIIFCFFCLIMGCMLLYETFHGAAIIDQLIFSVMYFLCVIIGSICITWYNKIAKADNALDLLAIYDKNKKIETCVTVYCLLVVILAIVSIIRTLSIGSLLGIMLLSPAIFVPTKKQKDEIEKLRKLIPSA